MNELDEFLRDAAAQHGVPGASAAVLDAGRTTYAAHGVTSLADPLPVTASTLFHLGSITKTFTATAIMRLAERGDLGLDVPVRTYLPDFRVADPDVSATVTLAHLLNHTAGWDGGFFTDSGDGDDALEVYVGRMTGVTQIAGIGERSSYCNAGTCVAGRVLEVVHGTTYERAVAELLLEPLGMEHTTFFANEAMTRRFAIGHNTEADGSLTAVTAWRGPRGANPGAGLTSTVEDMLRWARFHLGDGSTEDGERLLSRETVQRMQRPTMTLTSSALGDAIGIGWFLRTVGGVSLVGHGGSTSGQFAEFLFAPGRDFAVVVASNSAPQGVRHNQDVVQHLLDTRLGVVEAEPTPQPYDPTRARELLGAYENSTMFVHVRDTGDRLVLEFELKPEALAELEEEVADYPPFRLGLLPGDGYVLTDGAFAGMKGYFSRHEDGRIAGVDLSGRLFTRVAAS